MKGGSAIDIFAVLLLLPFASLVLFLGVVVYYTRGKAKVDVTVSGLGVRLHLKSDETGQSVSADHHTKGLK